MNTNNTIKFFAMICLSLLILACSDSSTEKVDAVNMHGEAAEPEVEKGPHRGRMLHDGDFSLELAIFETGVPPEFRAWATMEGELLSPDDVKLNIKLTRLGGKVDNINFAPQGDALRGDMVIYEPHSFVVSISASYQGTEHRWQYDNFEGRTQIELVVAEALGIKTEPAGPTTLHETIEVFGRVVPAANGISNLTARFPGVIKSITVDIGEYVKKGQTLATVESNESLNIYHVKAPIDGVIAERLANVGEQTGNQMMFAIINASRVWIELALFPADRQRVKVGAVVNIINPVTDVFTAGRVESINMAAEANQTVKARVEIDNKDGHFIPGSFVKAQVEVAQYEVELAVKKTGLQAFRDFTVVYARVNDEYEVRMLELGRQDEEWVEVLGGLEPGTLYVSENSYVIKADIEKSGASHDH